MIWYLTTIEQNRDGISNCCGISGNYPSFPDNPYITSNYSTCSDLDYTNIIVGSYYDVISPFNKRFITNIKDYDWDRFKTLFTYYDMNITASPINGGCIYQYDSNQNTNCLTNTVYPCVETVSM